MTTCTRDRSGIIITYDNTPRISSDQISFVCDDGTVHKPVTCPDNIDPEFNPEQGSFVCGGGSNNNPPPTYSTPTYPPSRDSPAATSDSDNDPTDISELLINEEADTLTGGDSSYDSAVWWSGLLADDAYRSMVVNEIVLEDIIAIINSCLLYTSPSPRD